MSSLLRAAVCVGLLAATVAASLPLRAAEPVNVIYFIIDELGYFESSAAGHLNVVAQIDAIARREHLPAVEGTFADTALHERDWAAKFGPGLPPPEPRPADKRPKSAGPAAGR